MGQRILLKAFGDFTRVKTPVKKKSRSFLMQGNGLNQCSTQKESVLFHLQPFRMPSEVVQAVCGGVVVAEADAVQMVNQRYYFPHESLKMQHFVPSDFKWK